MLKGLVIGIVLGVLGVAAGVYFYFATGRAPVACSASEMPFEHKLAHIALDAYLQKLPHPDPGVPADEKNLLAGVEVNKQHCAVCHGLSGQEKTALGGGRFPQPPALVHRTGGTGE